MNFAPHNLLVTGGAGFIGVNFVRRWLSRRQDSMVLVLDMLTYAGNERSLDGLKTDPRYRFAKGDICDTALVKELLNQYHIDTLVHFAAETHVDRSILGPDEFVRTNILGTHSLLKAAKEVWSAPNARRAHRFHHVSTDEVFGSLASDDEPFHEKTPYAPNSPYSASKAASDHLVRAYHETYGVQTTVTNCSNNYGAYQFPEKLIPLMIMNALTGKPLPVYGDGLQIRDWLHVEDHCTAIALALTRGTPGAVYNIGGASETTNIDIVSMICELLDDKIAARCDVAAQFPLAPASRGGKSSDLITFVEDRPGHDRRYAIDFAKAARELGYCPQQGLRGGLSATIDWYLENEVWWRPIVESRVSTIQRRGDPEIFCPSEAS